MTSTIESDVRLALDASAAKAAILGAFSPLKLLDLADPVQLAALKVLANDCIEVSHGDQPQWQLTPDARSRTLLRLRDTDRLMQEASAANPASTDRIGHFLKKILAGENIARHRVHDRDLGPLRTALQFAKPVVDRAEDANWLDGQVAKKDAEEAVRTLLPKRLIGRSRQLARLRKFVFENTGLADDFVFWLTGVGGVGKSALLAQLVKSLRGTNWNGVPVLTIDFDRPAFYQGRLAAIFLEIARQLELFRPDMGPALSRFRDAVRKNESSSSGDKFHDRATATIALLSAWKECLRDHLPLQGEVVIIFDTLEEVATSSNLSLHELTSCLHRLKAAGVPKLRPIFSGRAFHPEFSRGLPVHSLLALEDLGPAAALTLLQRMLVETTAFSEEALKQLVSMLGGNPLMLKILAVHLRAGGEAAATELLNDRSVFDKQFAQTFLYRRLLGRIRTDDPDLVKVAHPGLILRRVTPDLIQKVLAVPCGLKDVNSARANALFEKLSQQVWLVQSAGDNAVLHRKDLRRLMLQSMSALDAETAQEVHVRAVAYYSEYLDPVLTHEQQRIEYYYHRLFTPAAELPPQDALSAFVRALGEDIETLPERWRASVKVGTKQKLADAESKALPAAEASRYAGDEEERTISARGYSAQVNQAAIADNFGVLDAETLAVRMQNAYESGDLNLVSSNARRLVAAFGDAAVQERKRLDFTDSVYWRTAIASLRQPTGFLDALDASFVRTKAGNQLQRMLPSASKSEMTLAAGYFMLYRLHDRSPPDPIDPFMQHGSLIDRVSDLRYWQLGGLENPQQQGFEIRLRLLCDLSDGIQLVTGNSMGAVIFLDRAAIQEANKRGAMPDHVRGRVSLHDLISIRPLDGCVLIKDGATVSSREQALLKGLTPEVYPLVRAAARKCAASVLLDFADGMSSHRFWPADLERKELSARLKEDRESWTSTLIEVVDRTGELTKLVNHLIERGRGVRTLTQAVRDYDSRIRQFFNPG